MQSLVELHSRPNVSNPRSSVFIGSDLNSQRGAFPDEDTVVSKRCVVNEIRLGIAFILMTRVVNKTWQLLHLVATWTNSWNIRSFVRSSFCSLLACTPVRLQDVTSPSFSCSSSLFFWIWFYLCCVTTCQGSCLFPSFSIYFRSSHFDIVTMYISLCPNFASLFCISCEKTLFSYYFNIYFTICLLLAYAVYACPHDTFSRVRFLFRRMQTDKLF